MNNKVYGLLSGPSLVSSECLVKNLPHTFGAYIYKFTNTENGKIYIGYKVCDTPGEFVPSYWSSSTNQEFKDLINGDKPIVKYEIITFLILLFFSILPVHDQSRKVVPPC